jgi:hypothetical protein
MNIHLVNNKFLEDEWLNFPAKIYAKDQRRPLMPVADIAGIFDKTRNSFLVKGDAARWVVYDKNNLLAGRIAAYCNFAGVRGRIGFFESYNDTAVSGLLLKTSIDWLRSRNCADVDGPINIGEKDRYWGMQVSGFETEGLYMENHNPSYYQDLFLAFGFQPFEDINTYHITLDMVPEEKLKFFESYTKKKDLAEYRCFSFEEIDKLSEDIHAIYVAAFATGDRHTHITADEIKNTILEMKPILKEEFLWMAYINNRPMGFMVFLNEPEIPLFSRNRKRKKLKGLVMATVPDVHFSGVHLGLIYSFYKKMKKYDDDYDYYLVGINTKTTGWNSFIRKLGAQICKVHRTFTYKIPTNETSEI